MSHDPHVQREAAEKEESLHLHSSSESNFGSRRLAHGEKRLSKTVSDYFLINHTNADK